MRLWEKDRLEDLSRAAVIIGALLHDIGKFVQRAQTNPRAQKHTHWGEKWFSENLAEKIYPIFGFELTQKIASMINCHDVGEKFITAADNITAKERIDEDDPDVDPFSCRMISIFSKLSQAKDQEKYYKLAELKTDDFNSLMPIEDKTCNHTEYKKLLDNFNGELKLCDFSRMKTQQVIETLYHLLYKYSWCIASAIYKSEPDISLFEHLKTTAAIATCLYDLDDKDFKQFILLEGDISGIQNFIYSVTTEKALKGLRGRSFFLELLSQTITRRLLDEFNLSICNLLIMAGGNFTMLIPKTDDAEDRINTVLGEIDRIISKAFKNKLAVVFGYVVLAQDEFVLDRFDKVLYKLKEKLAREKKRKFKRLISEQFFQPYGGEKEESACEICGAEFKGENRCLLCRSFEFLSLDIKNAKYMEVEKIKPKKDLVVAATKWNEVLEAIGYRYRFFPANKAEKPMQKGNNLIYLINDTNFIKERCHGFIFKAIYSPVKFNQQTQREEAKTLEDIANGIEKGLKRWGALRMDVDNLGEIFSKGLKEKTISRYSMLSNMLSLFFSFGIKVLIDGEHTDCCVVYSGGDDLFIIGPWIELPQIAKEIRKRFSDYIGNKKTVTLSGGIFIAPSKKYPVYHAADLALQALNSAKKGNKDNITFLGETLPWDDFKHVDETKDELIKLLDNGVARSLLTILYAGYREKSEYEKKQIPFIRVWRLFYAIKRLMERHKEHSEQLEKLLRERFVQDFELAQSLNCAIRWAELLKRET